MNPALILGCGDIGRRVARLWRSEGGAVYGLARGATAAEVLAAADIPVVHGDLDQPETLHALPSAGAAVFYCAPPPAEGTVDTRLRGWLAQLTPATYPARIVYISTTGVYGDCQGAWVTEATPAHPRSARGQRRWDAEQALTAWSAITGVPVVILRVPGIYGPGRLPLERLRQGLPVVRPEDAAWSNRIHADDLARVCVAAATRGQPGAVYNVSDGQPSTMTDYFCAVADARGLPRPPIVSMEEARQVLSAGMLSFMEESRRLDNRKMLGELAVTLLYSDLQTGLRAC